MKPSLKNVAPGHGPYIHGPHYGGPATLKGTGQETRNEAEDMAATLKNLVLMLALAYRWELGIPNPPTLKYLNAVMFDDPNCPRLEIVYKDISVIPSFTQLVPQHSHAIYNLLLAWQTILNKDQT